MWRGSLHGVAVAVKSLRYYSSPELDPAEVGLVSLPPVHIVNAMLIAHPQRFLKEVSTSTQLSHPNIVPFLGVYSTPTHPLAILYEMMDNLDLGHYLVQHQNVSRLKLVSTFPAALATDPQLIPHFVSSPRYRVQWNTCTTWTLSTGM